MLYEDLEEVLGVKVDAVRKLTSSSKVACEMRLLARMIPDVQRTTTTRLHNATLIEEGSQLTIK